MFLLALTGRAEDPVELQATLDNEPVTVTFAFNLGTTGQKADFGEGAPFFINSKVNWGSNLEFYGLDANNIGQTLFMPIEQQNETEGHPIPLPAPFRLYLHTHEGVAEDYALRHRQRSA